MSTEPREAHLKQLTVHGSGLTPKQQLEQHHRIDRRTAIIGTVQMPDAIANEIELYERVNLTQHVILWNKRLQGHHLQHMLMRAGIF